MSTGKAVICGAGFLGAAGTHIARAVSATRPVQGISRSAPEKLDSALRSSIPEAKLFPSKAADIRRPETLAPIFKDASVVISLVGILNGTWEQFEGVHLIHISAIGADENSPILYAKSKGMGERAVFDVCPSATIIRPSLVFGPEDSFFNRFSELSKYLPFLPAFGGGTSRFQPVFVDDIAKAIEIISRRDPDIEARVAGKVIEAGGPEVFTWREIMELVLRYNGRSRPVVSLPFAVGKLQGALLEQLPENLFTVTRDQVETLKYDNIVNTQPTGLSYSFEDLLVGQNHTLTSVHDVVPRYLK
ncbi:hypothetical protein BD626DRAFT_546301 [Schizophyllum amplum]|uniref:NAD-dependent epimerase/dehydratase domain-containing protein n=1 Tax=Schizophyllum amplum TaxID=97359 RepID=A0A550CM48_9AGAR|nr:hypothetical protein BD626DRAFT_546301 [Auriculariopsis ampla]